MAQTHSLDLESSSSQYASITDASQTGLDLTGDLTFEFWINLESLADSVVYDLISKWSNTTSLRAYLFRIQKIGSTVNFYFNYHDSGGTARTAHTSFTTPIVAIGEWTHIAYTLDISTTGTLYVNGKSMSTVTPGGSSIRNTTAPFEIGRDGGMSNNYLDGLIKDVRVFSDVRTQSEIVTDARTESVTDANLEGEWNFNNAYTDGSGNGNTLTANGSPVFSTNIPWEETNKINGSTYLDTSIEWYSDMEDLTTSTIEDLVGALDGTKEAANQPLEAVGKVDNCQSFTTGGDHIDFSYNPRTAIGTGDFTVSMWVKMPTNSNRRTYIYFGDSGDVNFYDAFVMQGGNSSTDGSDINIAARDGTTGFVEISDGGGNLDDAWHHLVAVREGTTMSFYIDGILIDRTTDAEWGVNLGALARIGAGQADGNPMRDGELDEIGIWSRAMHYGDILDLYNEGTGIPYTVGVAYTQDVDETLTLADSITKEAQKAVDEVVTLVATISRDMQRALSETVTLVATSAQNLIINRELTESITLTASETIKIVGKTLSEAITLVSNLAIVKNLQRAFSETVTLVASIANVRTFNRAFSDVITLVSSITNVLSLGRIFTETIAVTERLYGLLNGVNMKYIDQYSDEVGEYVDQYFDI